MNIVCLLGQGFEDSEFQKPYDAFQKEGHQVTIVGIEAGKELHGDKGRVTATTDKGIADVRASDFDALFIPGGRSPDKLRANDDIVSFTQEFVDSGKPVFVICHGPQVLLTANRYKNRKLTAWKTVQGDLEKAGGNVFDKEVVVDGNWVSSRKPDDLAAFIEQSLNVLNKCGRAAA